MLTSAIQKEYYQALLKKDNQYEGVFYVGVKSTGIFCRPTCGARKPKFENCEFFSSAQNAILAGFRPCRRCSPLNLPGASSLIIEKLIKEIDNNPTKRWKDSDFRELSIDSSTVRRQFKKRFGMTFVSFARARRMGLALSQIKNGEPVIDAQLDAGYESSSGFRDAFSRILGNPPTKMGNSKVLKAKWLDTKLGNMLAIGDEKQLYLLEFVTRRGLEREIERLRTRMKSAIIPGNTAPLESIEKELAAYFDGNLHEFKTPLFLLGSDFQKQVWAALMKIPIGVTCSYAELAIAIGKPTACRAVANANGANQIAIVIPCHRVINSDGGIGGYGGGVAHKQWLLTHEKNWHEKILVI